MATATEGLSTDERLARIEAMLAQILERGAAKEWYTVDEVAGLCGRARFTVREWCRKGLIRAEKRAAGLGDNGEWVVSHAELERYRREGFIGKGRAAG